MAAWLIMEYILSPINGFISESQIFNHAPTVVAALRSATYR